MNYSGLKEDKRLIEAVPTARQIAYESMEFFCFIHFTVNTFTGREWGDGTEPESIFNPENLDCDQWVEAIKAAGSTDPADVLAALPNVVYENGVCGTVKFNENGDAEKNEAVVKHCNTETGEWEYVKTQSIEG